MADNGGQHTTFRRAATRTLAAVALAVSALTWSVGAGAG